MAETFDTFGEARSRLDEIVVEVRGKDLSLEKSLDLFEEAIKIGNRCAELVDKSDYTEQEALDAQEALSSDVPDIDLSGNTSQLDQDREENSAN